MSPIFVRDGPMHETPKVVSLAEANQNIPKQDAAEVIDAVDLDNEPPNDLLVE